MAGKTDNAKTNFDVTSPEKRGADTTTVFTRTGYGNDTEKNMQFPQYTHETKGDGQSELSTLPCPI